MGPGLSVYGTCLSIRAFREVFSRQSDLSGPLQEQCHCSYYRWYPCGSVGLFVYGDEQNWLMFEHVDGVTVSGGILDGQGTGLWSCKASDKSCPEGATSIEFSNSNNVEINGLASQDSQKFHIVINGCQNVKVQNVRVSAPGDSPNTDGIHVESSTGVTILNSKIGTGDDCVSIGPGTTNLWVENVACGPGHGIRQKLDEAGVQNVTVKTSTFTGTENGESGVKISDVTYQDIHGSSATEVAVKLDCSTKYPCTGIDLEDVKLTYNNRPAEASCTNAAGRVSGFAEASAVCRRGNVWFQDFNNNNVRSKKTSSWSPLSCYGLLDHITDECKKKVVHSGEEGFWYGPGLYALPLRKRYILQVGRARSNAGITISAHSTSSESARHKVHFLSIRVDWEGISRVVLAKVMSESMPMQSIPIQNVVNEMHVVDVPKTI
ncbi:hypothetical protein GH714_030922 [Hevea brasiliensis]|uniref:Polygalacturonase n=1 Tax=Hevea brasiliensis TaxID=3981 RepID=A0A6A6NK46_HEVBR|nr:hypothetical protein GH714_030922 [Hevea brasiliensis]